jgi:glycosyltransferase involved in cell wall biosynthesis
MTITIGDTMADELRHRYGDIPVTVIHNWEDGDFITPIDKNENEFAKKHGFDKIFTVLYSGNLGQHHDLRSIVEAAAHLEKDGFEDIQFVFIGEGGKKTQLRKRAEQLNLSSVQFLPYQPFEQLPQSLTSADVAVVSMAAGVEGLCVSSKLYSALASGQAILAISPSGTEVARIVNQSGCGVHVQPDNPEAIVAAIGQLSASPDRAAQMGRQAREVFESKFEQEVAIDAYYQVIKNIEI